MTVGIISWKYRKEISSYIRKMNVEVVDLLKNFEKRSGVDILVLEAIDLKQITGDKNQVLDQIRDLVSTTRNLVVANLVDEWVAEITKEVMKQSKVTVVDYNKSQFKVREGWLKAVYMVGLSLGWTPDETRSMISS